MNKTDVLLTILLGPTIEQRMDGILDRWREAKREQERLCEEEGLTME